MFLDFRMLIRFSYAFHVVAAYGFGFCPGFFGRAGFNASVANESEFDIV